MFILFLNMLFLLILLFTTNQAESKPNILKQNNVMHKIIDEFISYSTGINLYFCNPKDAFSTFKYYKNKPYAINSQVLLTKNYIKDITITFLQPPVLEIFLDLTCENGFKFLQQSSQLFNSSYRWLLWTDDYNQTLNQLHLSRVLLDSNVILAFLNGNSVIIYDLYKMHRSLPFTITEVKQWSSEGEIYPIAIPKPRNDFMGINISTAVVLRKIQPNQSNILQLLIDPTYVPDVDAKRRVNLCLMLVIAEYYNFKTRLIFNDTWGTSDENGSYNGFIGQVQRDEAEIGCSYTMLLTPRTRVIDFFMSVSFGRGAFLFLQPRTLGTYEGLIVPLESETWALLFITILFLILILNINGISDGSFSDNILVVLSTMSQQGAPEIIKTFPGRLIFLSLLFFSFFILQYYNIALLSGLLLPAPNAIQNWEQLIKSNLKFGVETDRYLQSDLQTNDTRSIEIRKKLANAKRVYFPIEEGLDEVRRGRFALYNIALDHYGKIQNKFTDSEVCSMFEIDKFRRTPTGPFGKKNGPYREHFRKIHLLLNEIGVANYLNKFWLPGRPECRRGNEQVVISAETLTIAFIIYLFGIFLSIKICMLEISIFKKKGNPHRPFLH